MICKKGSLLIFLALSFFCCTAQQKNLNIKHITSEDGLSDNQVTCIIKDKLGFMWIGTKDGLNRFDGKEFYQFHHNENDSNSLCGNSITCLENDNDSLLWIGTASAGFCSYNFRTGKFKTYNTKNLPLGSNNVDAIAFDKNKNRLWLGMNIGGLRTFDLASNKIISRVLDASETEKGTYLDVQINADTVYAAAIARQIQKIVDTKGRPLPPKDRVHTYNKIWIQDNSLWAGAWDNALHEFNSDAKIVGSYIFDNTLKYNYSGDEIVALCADENKILWCGTKLSGIHFFDLKKRQFTNTIQPAHPIKSRINCIYGDQTGRMWIGSDVGLHVFDPHFNQFETTVLPVPAEINSCKVNGRVITKGGKEFVITSCGLFYKLTGKENYSYKNFKYNKEDLQLTSIFKDSQESIYVGSNKTVHILDTTTIKLKQFNVKTNEYYNMFFSLYSSRVSSIEEIKYMSQKLLVAAAYGHCLFVINNKSNTIYWLNPSNVKTKINSEHLVRKLYVDSKGELWLCGVLRGISKLNLIDNSSVNSFSSKDTLVNEENFTVKMWMQQNDITAINNVYDIVENANGTYWLSTQGAGLVKFNPTDEAQPYTLVGKKFQSLQGLTKNDENNLWMISSAGLLHYKVKENRYMLYDKTHGIPQGLSGYFFNPANEKLAAGFNGGFIEFNPANILTNSEKPDAYLSRFWVMDAACDSLLFSKINLKHNQNFLKFYVSSNTFSNNEQTTFMYFLEGIDHEWRSNQNNPLITYTNLPHGNFLLKVKAINSDGVASDEMLLPINITPPFYQTFWFYLIVVLLLAAALYSIYKYRIQQILKLQEVRNKIARDLHDDIGSTIGSIHLYSQIANVKLQQKKPEEIKAILNKIGSSSREIIDKTGDAVWAVKASNDTLKNLILRMESYAASLLGTAGIHFTIDCDEKNSEMKLEMNQRKNIFLIFKEAIHNIIKYAQCTEVTICIKKIDGKMQVQIKDNGRGFNASEINPYNGNGIKNMKGRAEEMGGNFLINSELEKGTTISIII